MIGIAGRNRKRLEIDTLAVAVRRPRGTSSNANISHGAGSNLEGLDLIGVPQPLFERSSGNRFASFASITSYGDAASILPGCRRSYDLTLNPEQNI